jgi:hypothetical protein
MEPPRESEAQARGLPGAPHLGETGELEFNVQRAGAKYGSGVTS